MGVSFIPFIFNTVVVIYPPNAASERSVIPGSPPRVTDRSPNAKKEAAAKESHARAGGSDPSGMPMPQHQGGDGFAKQLATVPVVTMLLGSVVGIGAAKAMVTHFSVMVRGISQLFVAGPPVVKVTMNTEITKEELGDWRIHATNGSVDNLAESEEEAAWMARRFLSYLPSNVFEVPCCAHCCTQKGMGVKRAGTSHVNAVVHETTTERQVHFQSSDRTWTCLL